MSSEFKEELLSSDYNISLENIEHAKHLLGIDSFEIYYNHYIENHYDNLMKLKDELFLKIFSDISNNKYVNSIKSRVKDPYHVVAKIVKKINKKSEYAKLTLDNYHLMVDDLLGFKIIMLYSDDWSKIHEILNHHLTIDPAKFTKTKSDFVSAVKSLTIKDMEVFKKVEVKLRKGDNDIYSPFYKDDFNKVFDKQEGQYYRSIHYSVFYQKYCFEIQVRSIYDEAWGEIDHNLIYPYYLNDEEMVDYSKMLNRLAGISNEMAVYFKNVIFPQKDKNHALPTLNSVPDELALEHIKFNIANEDKEEKERRISNSEKTPRNILNEIKDI